MDFGGHHGDQFCSHCRFAEDDPAEEVVRPVPNRAKKDGGDDPATGGRTAHVRGLRTCGRCGRIWNRDVNAGTAEQERGRAPLFHSGHPCYSLPRGPIAHRPSHPPRPCPARAASPLPCPRSLIPCLPTRARPRSRSPPFRLLFPPSTAVGILCVGLEVHAAAIVAAVEAMLARPDVVKLRADPAAVEARKAWLAERKPPPAPRPCCTPGTDAYVHAAARPGRGTG